MPGVPTQHLGKIFSFFCIYFLYSFVIYPGIIKGLSLFICSLGLHGRSLGLLPLKLHVKILNLTCESPAMPVRLVQMPLSWTGADSPHPPDMLMLIQLICFSDQPQELGCLPRCSVRSGGRRLILHWILFPSWLFRGKGWKDKLLILVSCYSQC